MLFYIIIPLYVVWILSYLILWFKGHYPTQYTHIHILIYAATGWTCFYSRGETPLLYVGLITPICASILWVPTTLYLAANESALWNTLWKMFLILQVVGYFILCVAFCIMDIAINACVAGTCLVLSFVYADKVYNSSVSSDSNIALLSISI
jgi:hypothetical protein